MHCPRLHTTCLHRHLPLCPRLSLRPRLSSTLVSPPCRRLCPPSTPCPRLFHILVCSVSSTTRHHLRLPPVSSIPPAPSTLLPSSFFRHNLSSAPSSISTQVAAVQLALVAAVWAETAYLAGLRIDSTHFTPYHNRVKFNRTNSDRRPEHSNQCLLYTTYSLTSILVLV
ncbi:hypothetical protein BDD12DRAFT_73936 [Trichophaea hybrida]|nr:hypothetical protein BDD12DRAFT_73936 [Trichophaea hybrida]